MRVQMKTKIGGYRDGVEWPEVGGSIDVPEHEAADLCAAGYAQMIEETDDADQDPADPDDEGEEAGAGSDPEADADGDDSTDAGAEADAGVDPPAPVTRARRRT